MEKLGFQWTDGRTLIKFYVWDFFENFLKNSSSSSHHPPPHYFSPGITVLGEP
jgi:hypothetical protein